MSSVLLSNFVPVCSGGCAGFASGGIRIGLDPYGLLLSSSIPPMTHTSPLSAPHPVACSHTRPLASLAACFRCSGLGSRGPWQAVWGAEACDGARDPEVVAHRRSGAIPRHRSSTSGEVGIIDPSLQPGRGRQQHPTANFNEELNII